MRIGSFFPLYINMQYLLNEEQRNFVKEIFNENQKKLENAKKEKYNPDNLFLNKQINADISKTNNLSIVEYKESIFTKIKNWLKQILKNRL